MPIDKVTTIRDRIEKVMPSNSHLTELLFPVRNLPLPEDSPDPVEAESVVRFTIKEIKKWMRYMERHLDASFQIGLPLGDRMELINDLEELAKGYHQLAHSDER